MLSGNIGRDGFQRDGAFHPPDPESHAVQGLQPQDFKPMGHVG
jgi:hypothetical protein